MLKVWILAITIVPFVAPFPTNDGNEDAYRLNAGQHDFSLSMLKMLEKNFPGRNHIFSPHSTYRVLLQAYLAVNLSKRTVDSMERGMHLGWSKNENDVVNAYMAESTTRANRVLGDGIEFESANKLYVSRGFSLKPRAMELFANSIEKVDFTDAEARRKEINTWVEEITRNHIVDLIPQGLIKSDTDLVLANAAYFKGTWANKFNKKNTQVETFHGATPADVEMMTITAKFNVGELEGENADFLEMPYVTDDKSLSMFVYLPRENKPTAVDDLLSKISTKTISQALRGNQPQKVHLQFPKMSLDGEYKLSETFESMGFNDLPYDDVVHKAKIDVDEEGSVASAATAAIMSRGMDIPIEFHCDHPFIFMINDRVTHEILFAGVYRGPAA